MLMCMENDCDVGGCNLIATENGRHGRYRWMAVVLALLVCSYAFIY